MSLINLQSDSKAPYLSSIVTPKNVWSALKTYSMEWRHVTSCQDIRMVVSNVLQKTAIVLYLNSKNQSH